MGLATVPCLEILRSSVPGIQAALLTDMAPRPSEDENLLPSTTAHGTTRPALQSISPFIGWFLAVLGVAGTPTTKNLVGGFNVLDVRPYAPPWSRGLSTYGVR